MKLAAKQCMWLALALGAMTATTGRAQSTTSLKGAKDHPMISRFQGSVIVGQEKRDFDSYRLPLGPATDHITGNMDDKFKDHLDVEGKITRTMYFAPPGSSPLLVYRSYENALKQAGLVTMFTCELSSCKGTGWLPNFYAAHWPMGGNSLGDEGRVLVAKLSRPDGDVYVSLCSSTLYCCPEKVYTFVDVIETKPMAGGLVTVNAATMANDIAQTGHQSIYGIYFDFGKADLKPESDATLDQRDKEIKKWDTLYAEWKKLVQDGDTAGATAKDKELSKQSQVVSRCFAQINGKLEAMNALQDAKTLKAADEAIDKLIAKEMAVLLEIFAQIYPSFLGWSLRRSYLH